MRDNRRRILHLIDTLRPGGAEQLVLTTVKHLDPSRFESVVAALFPPLDLKEDLERCGVPVHCLGLSGRLDWWRGTVSLARLLGRYRVEILHTHLYYANVYGRIAAFLARVPIVVSSLHYCDYSNQDVSRVTVKLRKLADRLTAQRINSLFIAVSDVVREDYRRHIGLRGVKVLHNYVDVGEFSPASVEARHKRREAFQCSDQDFILIHVGRLHGEKGQQYLLLAMKEVVRVIQKVRLFLVGEGPDESRLRILAREQALEHVVSFVGQQRDIAGLLAMADLFVFPSIVEGLGIALLEAMAMGMPVIASRVEGIPEVVDHGVNGLLVEPRDATGLARAVIRLYENPTLARSLGDKARRTVFERFSTEVGIPQLEAMYSTLAPLDQISRSVRGAAQ